MLLKGVQQKACKQKKLASGMEHWWGEFWMIRKKTVYVFLRIENPPKFWAKTANNSIPQNNDNNNNNNNDDDNK